MGSGSGRPRNQRQAEQHAELAADRLVDGLLSAELKDALAFRRQIESDPASATRRLKKALAESLKNKDRLRELRTRVALASLGQPDAGRWSKADAEQLADNLVEGMNRTEERYWPTMVDFLAPPMMRSSPIFVRASTSGAVTNSGRGRSR